VGHRCRRFDGRRIDGGIGAEKALTDERIAAHTTLDSVGAGNGYSLGWNLQKLIGEYARHNGHADLIRERIDGQTGE
jgi:hypothetical protein